MQKIPLMRASAGMVLARDVFRSDSPVGAPVCGKDTVLTETLIARLQNLDVQSICVAGHPLREAGDKTLDDMLLELDRRFEKVRQDHLMNRLHEIFAEQLKRSLGGDGGRPAQ